MLPLTNYISLIWYGADLHNHLMVFEKDVQRPIATAWW